MNDYLDQYPVSSLKHPLFSDATPKIPLSPLPLHFRTSTSSSSHYRATTSAAQQVASQPPNLFPPSPPLSFSLHYYCHSPSIYSSAAHAQTIPHSYPPMTSAVDNHRIRRSRTVGSRLSAGTAVAGRIGTSRLSRMKSRRDPRSSTALSGRNSLGMRIGMWRI